MLTELDSSQALTPTAPADPPAYPTARSADWRGAVIGASALKIRSLLQIRQVTSDAEYECVIHLRHDCYRGAGKLPSGTNTDAAARRGDDDARIFGLWLGPVLVGTFTVRVPRAGDVLETIDGALGYYPSDLPSKASVIEVSALCVRRGFRRTDVFKAVCEQVHRILVETNRSHILLAADERLQRKYRFIHFRLTRHSYIKPYGRIHVMVSNQKPLGIYGLHTDPIRWHMFLRDVTDQLIAENKLRHGLLEKCIFWVYRQFAGLSTAVEAQLAAPRRLT
ncbi:hypothetical protein LZC95_08150 [Pendulispora brunnea]|uniref:N-acyl amino acid synthase FeeM catalytic core domain-containing protein n=1 Tax=Pendulispora brunnea TaxID=2905690 RepID=A0ABZ2KDQ9_9BACT